MNLIGSLFLLLKKFIRNRIINLLKWERVSVLQLKKSKLVKLPSLFEERPNLLEEVFEVELVKKETVDSNMRRLYTKCDCSFIGKMKK